MWDELIKVDSILTKPKVQCLAHVGLADMAFDLSVFAVATSHAIDVPCHHY
jgi:hypothetical protein